LEGCLVKFYILKPIDLSWTGDKEVETSNKNQQHEYDEDKGTAGRSAVKSSESFYSGFH
jgi:hypothetical protein